MYEWNAGSRRNRIVRARELVPGDVLIWSTKPRRTVASISRIWIKSQFPPHNEYKGVEVVFTNGQTFTRGESSWVFIAACDHGHNYC